MTKIYQTVKVRSGRGNVVGSGTTDVTGPSTPVLTATASGSSSISLHWTASTDPSGVSGYQLYRSTDNATWGSPIYTGAVRLVSNPYSDTGLNASTRYYYQVRAYDPYTNYSGYGQASATTSEAQASTYWPTQGTVTYTPIVRNARGLALNSVGGSGRVLDYVYSSPGAYTGFGANAPSAVTIRRVTYGGSQLAFGDSFRAAVAAHNAGTGPSLIVFDSSGTMDLNGASVRIDRGLLTIAGQTAPSPGVQYRNGKLGIRAPSDVLIQHLRGQYPEAYPNTELFDGFWIHSDNNDIRRMVIDHCAFMWCTDSCGDVDAGGTNPMVHSVAYLNSIFAEGLYTTDGGTRLFIMGTRVYEFLIYGCILAHSNARQPRTKARRGTMVNNIHYNWGNYAWELDQPDGGLDVDIPQRYNAVGNCYVRGLNDLGRAPIRVNSNGTVNAESKAYVSGNKLWNRTTDLNTGQDAAAQWTLVDPTGEPLTQEFASMDWPAGLIAATSDEARTIVLSHAGPRPGERDTDIQRLINEITTGTGTRKVIGDFVLPTYAQNTANPVFPAAPDTGDWRDIVTCTDGLNRTRLEKHLHDLEDAVL